MSAAESIIWMFSLSVVSTTAILILVGVVINFLDNLKQPTNSLETLKREWAVHQQKESERVQQQAIEGRTKGSRS